MLHRLIAVKSAVPDAGAAPAAQVPEQGMPSPTSEPVRDDFPERQEWAGDLIEHQGEHTDPREAFAVFRGPNGEWAWLDRTPTGATTGWVKTPDGNTYRYDDADAWSVDVDDAGMARTDEAGAELPAQSEAAEEPVESSEDEELPLNAEDAAASGGAGSSTRDQTNTPFPNLQGKAYLLRITHA